MIVTKVKESDWDKKDGSPIVKVTNVTLDDGREVPGYDLPSVPEVGKPLPDGWTVETGKSGKLYIKVPKPGGGGGQAAYRNTREGFLLEQEGYARKEEATDRRTAWMQANENWRAASTGVLDYDALMGAADIGYIWLRKTKTFGLTTTTGDLAQTRETVPPAKQVESPSPVSAQDAGGPTSEQGDKRSEQDTEPDPRPGSAAAATPCSHTSASGDKPDGSPLPGGRVRCLACGKISDREGSFA